MNKRLLTLASLAAFGVLTGCNATEVHPQAFLDRVRAEALPATAQLDDEVLLGHAETICGNVEGAEGWLEATMRDYEGVSFGDNPTLVDAAVEAYCPEVGAKVNGEIEGLS